MQAMLGKTRIRMISKPEVKQIMKSKRKQPYRCLVCGNRVNFTALVARVKAVHYRQTTAHNWANTGREAARLDVKAVLAFVCEGCGHPGMIPGDVLKNAETIVLNRLPKKLSKRQLSHPA